MTVPALVLLAVTVLIGYVLGAVPSGVIVGRLRGVDPRASGSGRTGTTNALRTLGLAGAIAVAFMDLGKGALAVILARLIVATAGGELADWAGAAAGVAAVIGHVRSVFIGFGGGRGVATGAGAAALVVPLGLLAAGPVFLLTVWRTRLVSLGSIMAAITVPTAAAILLSAGWVDVPALAFGMATGVVITLAHADNIVRLRAGTERRLGEPVEPGR
ncbi:MAG: glycerol-3-phosphate acyltransferase [Candidatus Limnocylindria bacterium]